MLTNGLSFDRTTLSFPAVPSNGHLNGNNRLNGHSFTNLRLPNQSYQEIVLARLYGRDPQVVKNQMQRYEELSRAYKERFGRELEAFFSSPGRIELSGNHTDHNGGKVLTASVNLDAAGAVGKAADGCITIVSNGYPEVRVNVAEDARKAGEKGADALVRGIVNGFRQRGGQVGGLSITLDNRVPSGSGLSSSAAFEMLVGQAINEFYNGGHFSVLELAQIGRHAENNYWDKQSGLLDQLGCGLGGINTASFKDAANPAIRRVNFDFASSGLAVLIIETGGSHDNLTEDYSAIPREMRDVAASFGKKNLCEVAPAEFLAARGRLLQEVDENGKRKGERRILRAMHFFEENVRVGDAVRALERMDLRAFLKQVNASGRSSEKLLQNIFSAAHPQNQGVSLALSEAETALRKISVECLGGSDPGYAVRVHGGGFAGTIMVILADCLTESFGRAVAGVIPAEHIHRLNVRQDGVVNVSRILADELKV